MNNSSLDFLFIAPTPFYANRGCHLRIRGEAEALQKKGYRTLIYTFKEGGDVAGLNIKRSPFGLGKYSKQVANSWYNIPNGIILFFGVLHATLYGRPKIIYGHLFEGGAIGILVKYLAVIFSLFNHKPILALDTQGGLAEEMESYGMFKKESLRYRFFKILEKFISFFPDYIFTSSVQCAENLKENYTFSNPICLPDGISFFQKEANYQSLKKLRLKKGETLTKMAGSFSSSQKSLIEKWLEQKNTILLYGGSFSPAKGFPFFVKKILPDLLEQTKINFLFGGGNQNDIIFLDYLVKKYPDRISILNDLNSKNLLNFYLLGDIAIDCKPPKTSESSGKILNYMAAGLPVVCFSQLNNRAFLHEGGLYSKNPLEFSKNIIKLADQPELRREMGNKNFRRAWQEFSWDKTADKIVKMVMRIEE